MLLSEAVETYVRRKQLMGRKYDTCGKELRALARLYPEVQLSAIRTHHVANFLNYKPLCRDTWIGKYKRLRAFFSYWISRRKLTSLPMPAPRRPGHRSFTPYIFTPVQMRSILARAPEIQSRKQSAITPEMFRNIDRFSLRYGLLDKRGPCAELV